MLEPKPDPVARRGNPIWIRGWCISCGFVVTDGACRCFVPLPPPDDLGDLPEIDLSADEYVADYVYEGWAP